MRAAHSATGFPALLRAFRLALLAEGRSPKTIANYLRDVEAFFRRHPLPPRAISPGLIRSHLAQLQEGRSPKTVREAQIALRRFFRFLVQEGEIRQDPTREMRLTAFRIDPQPAYTRAEVKRLLLACGGGLEGLRDRALVLTLYDTGVRAGELCSMGLPDWEGGLVRVRGKTGARDVPLSLTTLQALERYCRRWRIEEPPLWRGRRGPLTPSGAYQLVRRLCRQANVPFKGLHAFRRAAAIAMKEAGMNDSDIMEVLGWKHVTMLKRYTAQEAQALAFTTFRRRSPASHLP